MWKDFTFLDRFANDAVERLDRIGRINGTPNIFGIVKQRDQIGPVPTPLFTDIWVLIIPLGREVS